MARIDLKKFRKEQEESSEKETDETRKHKEKSVLEKKEKFIETPEDVVTQKAFESLVVEVNSQFESVDQTLAALNDTLKDVNKTIGERQDAVEKQLKDAQAINKNRVPILHEEDVSEDIIFKGIGESTPKPKVLQTLNKAYSAPTDSELLKEWQTRTTHIKILSQCLGKSPQELEAWEEHSKFLEDTGISKIVTLAGAPTNFIPVGWDPEIQRYFYQELEIAQMFSEFTMPQNPFDRKILGRAQAVRYTERTSSTATRGTHDPTYQDPQQGNVRFDAKVMMVPILITEEFAEDTLMDYMTELTEEHIPMALAQGLEKAIINGDVAKTHQDDGEATNSVARNFDGLRRIALERTGTVSGATYNMAMFTSALRKAGKFGVRPRDGAWIMSNSAYTQSLALTQFETLDKTNMPTNTEGAVNMLLGRPVYVSGEFPEKLDATGVVSGTAKNNVKTGVLHVNRRQFRIGRRRETTVKMEEDIRLQSWVIVATDRCDFQALEDRRAGYTPSIFIINITSNP